MTTKEVWLPDRHTHTEAWSYTMTPSTDQTLHQIMTLLLNLAFSWNTRGFHRAFPTVVACLQGKLTPPDTCSHPIWLLHMLYLRSTLFPIASWPWFLQLCTESIPLYCLGLLTAWVWYVPFCLPVAIWGSSHRNVWLAPASPREGAPG